MFHVEPIAPQLRKDVLDTSFTYNIEKFLVRQNKIRLLPRLTANYARMSSFTNELKTKRTF